jgi:hypothetical protein
VTPSAIGRGGLGKALKNSLPECPIVTFFTPEGPISKKNRIFSVLQLGVMGWHAIHSACREASNTISIDHHGEMYGEGAKSSSKEEGRSEGSSEGRQGGCS